MKQKELVSVIIPCYNAEYFISETITSVLTQSYTNIELIIINDGSTDNSEKEILAFDDNRVHYFKIKNQGVSKARNIGVSYAKGEFLAFLDADDLFDLNNLEQKTDYLNTYKEIGLVHSLEQIFDHITKKNIKITEGKKGNVLNDLLEMNSTVIHSPASILMRHSLFADIGGFDENLSTSADWEFWVRVAKNTKIGLINVPLIKYRVHPQQMHLNVPKMDKDMNYAFDKHQKLNTFKNKKHYQYCYSKLCLILSASYIGDNKNYGIGLKYLIKSILTHSRPLIQRLSR